MILGFDNSTGHLWRPRQRVHPNRSRCSGLSSIGSLQTRRRISRLEPSTSHRVLASRLCYFGYPGKIGLSSTHANMGGCTVYTLHDVHDMSDAARPPQPGRCTGRWQALALHEGFMFYKLPQNDGEAENVGSPLTKTFSKYTQDQHPQPRAEADGRMAAARARYPLVMTHIAKRALSSHK